VVRFVACIACIASDSENIVDEKSVLLVSRGMPLWLHNSHRLLLNSVDVSSNGRAWFLSIEQCFKKRLQSVPATGLSACVPRTPSGSIAWHGTEEVLSQEGIVASVESTSPHGMMGGGSASWERHAWYSKVRESAVCMASAYAIF
jgi:hypothetical protein